MRISKKQTRKAETAAYKKQVKREAVIAKYKQKDTAEKLSLEDRVARLEELSELDETP